MSSPLLPTTGRPAAPTTRTPSGTTPQEELSAFVAELGAHSRPLTIGAYAAGPPSELLEQVADAGRLQEQLRERGEALRFSAHEPGLRVSITLNDGSASAPRALSLSEAFAIASGESAE